MKKTSIYLEPSLDEALAARAAEEGLSKAELIRRTLERSLETPPRPKLSFGVFASTDGKSAATHMDEFMEGFGE